MGGTWREGHGEREKKKKNLNKNIVIISRWSITPKKIS